MVTICKRAANPKLLALGQEREEPPVPPSFGKRTPQRSVCGRSGGTPDICEGKWFDDIKTHNSRVLRCECKRVFFIEEAAKFSGQDPQLRQFKTGHIDWVGTWARADAPT